MPNFISLGFVDTVEIVGSLRQRWGLFKADPERPGYRTLPMRGHARDSEEADDKFANYATGAKWVEFNNLRSELARRGEAILPPGVEFGRIFFEMIDAGATLDWQKETAPYFERWTRAILPLRTNPAALLIYGTETATPGPGWLTAISPRLPHAAINLGDHAWVTLTVDFRRKSSDV